MASPNIPAASGRVLGSSREGRPVAGFRFGRGPEAVSLLGGCHADEPVGPRLLRRLAGYLAGLDADDPMLTRHQWWIIPHLNPDGERRNAPWQDPDTDAYDLGRYLAGKVRELPGDDIEFGFPRDDADPGARPENRAAYDWWRTCDRPFALHASLHGMGFAAGPFFLIDGTWETRCEALKASCRHRARGLGYVLHDAERHGEKGFFRFERGFASRPDSTARHDGLVLRGAWVTAAVRCAPPGNKPTAGERERCRGYLERELDFFAEAPVIVALGGFSFAALLRTFRERGEPVPRPAPRFGHGVEVEIGPRLLIGSYHPSQQNTFTGTLTEPMFDAIWTRAARLVTPPQCP